MQGALCDGVLGGFYAACSLLPGWTLCRVSRQGHATQAYLKVQSRFALLPSLVQLTQLLRGISELFKALAEQEALLHPVGPQRYLLIKYVAVAAPPQGFYGVYSELFKALAEQEAAAFAASDAAGAKNATAPTYPSFGSSDSAAAEVFGFYRCWESFVTYKDFAWADPYNPAQAPNRQVCVRAQQGFPSSRGVQVGALLHKAMLQNNAQRPERLDALLNPSVCYYSVLKCLQQTRCKMEDKLQSAARAAVEAP